MQYFAQDFLAVLLKCDVERKKLYVIRTCLCGFAMLDRLILNRCNPNPAWVLTVQSARWARISWSSWNGFFARSPGVCSHGNVAPHCRRIPCALNVPDDKQPSTESSRMTCQRAGDTVDCLAANVLGPYLFSHPYHLHRMDAWIANGVSLHMSLAHALWNLTDLVFGLRAR